MSWDTRNDAKNVEEATISLIDGIAKNKNPNDLQAYANKHGIPLAMQGQNKSASQGQNKSASPQEADPVDDDQVDDDGDDYCESNSEDYYDSGEEDYYDSSC